MSNRLKAANSTPGEWTGLKLAPSGRCRKLWYASVHKVGDMCVYMYRKGELK